MLHPPKTNAYLTPATRGRTVELQCQETCPRHVQPVHVQNILGLVPLMPKDGKDIGVNAEVNTDQFRPALLIGRAKARKLGVPRLAGLVEGGDGGVGQGVNGRLSIKIEAAVLVLVEHLARPMPQQLMNAHLDAKGFLDQSLEQSFVPVVATQKVDGLGGEGGGQDF